jgi:DNA-binding HxlR family transcriptional regulator
LEGHVDRDHHRSDRALAAEDERDGLITRTVYAEVPPRVVYAVTDLGRSLGQCVRLLGSWVAENQEAIVENRGAFDEAKA